MSDRTDWNAMKLVFITDPSKPTFREFAGKQKIALKTVQNRSSREKWGEAREEYWANVTSKASPILEDMQAVVTARDTASRLIEIRTMANAAYLALQPQKGDGLKFEKASDAIAAYERLIKLERLLTDQSTENISITEARQLVDDVLTVIEEVTRDYPDLQKQIRRRLSSLQPAAIENPSEVRKAIN